MGVTTIRTLARWPHTATRLELSETLQRGREFCISRRLLLAGTWSGTSHLSASMSSMPSSRANFTPRPASAAFVFSSPQRPSTTQYASPASDPRPHSGPPAYPGQAESTPVRHKFPSHDMDTPTAIQPPPSLGEYPSRHEVLCKKPRRY
ncbi:hypothetical protein S40293_10524 [Stachybotrys chartarum IBT 40293]|nr:hypothetical protein S40293_10524 [Stachybotrys chartarum IBT 40293]